ncbi:hypothetical protein ILYODFUR_000615 [Ilyodon furcidens]|uniref:Uncharacterized protein n=1 Tax=Ilyodon furcidens TaxID=33524 RepID=A0ABV0TGE1_9TELE
MSANRLGPGEDNIDAKQGDGKQPAGSLFASSPMDVDATPHSHSFRYSLSFPSIGQCIVINNKNFDRSTATEDSLEGDYCMHYLVLNQ